jgi:hypothetical protein
MEQFDNPPSMKSQKYCLTGAGSVSEVTVFAPLPMGEYSLRVEHENVTGVGSCGIGGDGW